MKLTNNTGIIAPLFEECMKFYNHHSKMDDKTFSATEALGSVKQIFLKKTLGEDDEKEVDVQNVMRTIRGTWNHESLELRFKNRTDCIVEKTLYTLVEVETFFGKEEVTLSGTPDMIWIDGDDDYHLVDWKTTTQYSVDKYSEGSDTRWKDQSYIYAYLIEKVMGKRPLDAIFVGFLDDKKPSMVDLSDPKTWPVQQVVYDLSDREYEKNLMDGVIGKISSVRNAITSGELPSECTESERWQSAEKWGTKKTDGVKWTYYTTYAEAVDHVNNIKMPKKGVKPVYEIRRFPSEPKRCMDWCDCINVCEQGQRLCKEYKTLVEKLEQEKKASAEAKNNVI